MRAKNLILCFRHKALFKQEYLNTFCGLGDIITGFVYCFSVCQSLGLNFYVDFDGHVLEKFLNYKKFSFNKKPPAKINFVNGVDLGDFIYSNNSEDLFLMTNGVLNFNYKKNKTLKDAFQFIFLQNSKIIDYINKQSLKFDSVLHARFGDTEMVEKNFIDDFYLRNNSHPYSPSDAFKIWSNESRYKLFYDHFKHNIDNYDFLCTDHINFKKFIKNKMHNISFLESKPAHSGIKNSNYVEIFNTLCEFYLIFNCSEILSVSAYPFGERMSGLIYWSCFFIEKKATVYSIDIFRNEIKQL